MFKDSNITRLDAWSLVEESDALPEAAFPAFIGSGKIGIGLDAAGLQSLPDRLGTRYHCTFAPWHSTQADLYLFRDGMITEHLWQDEIKFTEFDPESPAIAQTAHRNLMPLGYLTQSLTFDGQTYSGDGSSPRSRRLASRLVAPCRNRTDKLRHTIRTSTTDYELVAGDICAAWW